jgi:HK97 family phage prohead protease
MPPLEYKSFPLLLSTKADEPTGHFTGYAAAYTKDLYGDRILPGAFGQSIKDQKGMIPIFLNHDSDLHIGFSTDLAEDAKGLYIEAVLSLESRQAADTYALLQTAKSIGYRMGLSIGFVPTEVDYDEPSQTRLLKGIELWETSITPFPANRSARIDSIKSVRNLEQVLRDAGHCSREEAKRIALCLQPYLSVDADGNLPLTQRDAGHRGQPVMAAILAALRR